MPEDVGMFDISTSVNNQYPEDISTSATVSEAMIEADSSA